MLGLIALSTPNWHNIDAGTFHHRKGIFQDCRVFSPDHSECNPTTLEEEFCGHRDELVAQRHGWSATFAIIAILAFLGSSLIALAGWCNYSLLTVPSMALAFVGAFTMAIAVSIFTNTYAQWYYCGLEYCAYAQYYLGTGEDCFSYEGYSFTLAILSIVLALVSAFISALLVRATRLEKIDEQGNPINAATRRAAAEIARLKKEMALVSRSAAKQLPASEMHPASLLATSSMERPPPPEGDWIWRDESAMYWSDRENLYLDPFRKQYFDPAAQAWYDPTTDRWIPV